MTKNLIFTLLSASVLLTGCALDGTSDGGLGLAPAPSATGSADDPVPAVIKTHAESDVTLQGGEHDSRTVCGIGTTPTAQCGDVVTGQLPICRRGCEATCAGASTPQGPRPIAELPRHTYATCVQLCYEQCPRGEALLGGLTGGGSGTSGGLGGVLGK
jgi:hypothetical protein